MIISDRNKETDMEEWSIWGGGRLERFYCVYMYIYIYIYTHSNIYFLEILLFVANAGIHRHVSVDKVIESGSLGSVIVNPGMGSWSVCCFAS